MSYGFTGTKLMPFILGTTSSYKPKVRNDIDQIYYLRNYLKKLTPNNEIIYIVSLSDVLNNDILTKPYLPDKNLDINIAGVSQVDTRDGFSSKFFESNVIVEYDPIQLHLVPENQEVVRSLAEIVVGNNGISQKLKYVDSVVLQNNVKAIIRLMTLIM